MWEFFGRLFTLGQRNSLRISLVLRLRINGASVVFPRVIPRNTSHRGVSLF